MDRKRKRGSTIKSDAREIIANICSVCEEEAKNNSLFLPLVAKTQRAAMYTGISVRTIQRIKTEDIHRKCNSPGSKLTSPGKKRSRAKITDKIDDSVFQVIRRTLEHFYLNLKQAPTLKKLLAAVREKIDFPYQEKTLSTLLKKNGFIWRKCQNNKKILIERPNIVSWRLKYLRAIRKYRNENKNIIYIDATWIGHGLAVNNVQSNETVCVKRSSLGRFVVVHGGSEDGFVRNAALVFQTGATSGYCNGQLNKEKFEKWLTTQLLPNIPSGSVIVMDNAPYHSEVVNKVPTKSSTKQAMISWLQNNNISHDPISRKTDLFEVIYAHKPIEKIYRIDTIIRKNGHIPLRLPPNMYELNPIKLAWADVKRYIWEHNTVGGLSLNDVKKLTEDGIDAVSKSDWEGYCKHVLDIENIYWERDGRIEEIIDEIIINQGTDTSDEDDTPFSSSSDEYNGDETDEIKDIKPFLSSSEEYNGLETVEIKDVKPLLLIAEENW